ncbi:MAG: RNA-directed DNA polymerase [Oscillospiraceae bacterium]|nr:RNA-directed DNA polymerase [Oscillospiraceae bacterium]
MVDLNMENYRNNTQLLLRGLWYSDLPDLLDMEELVDAVDDIFDEINHANVPAFKQDTDGFITEFKMIDSPPYIRSPGVEAISFFDFKKNKSLREMQIPNLLHYLAFMYNTMLEFSPLFEALYIEQDNEHYVKNSNSYLVFGEEFVLSNYNDETKEWEDDDWVLAGVFTTKNNKINSSAAFEENKKRVLAAERDYIYSLKMDIESFFPNLYTHNFEKMADKEPFSKIGVDFRYFQFLDQFHQRINNNQTKGIPAGTFSSHVAAELCMLCVDEEIRKYLSTRKNPVGYIRYVDDLTFYSDSESELAALYPAVQSILNQYRLRINGNKTEALRAVYAMQSSYLTELDQNLPKLKLADEAQTLQLVDFFALKRYIGVCLKDGRSSQIRTVLNRLLGRIQANILVVDDVIFELFCFLLKLVFEDVTLVSHVYRLLDLLLSKASEPAPLLEALQQKQEKIDAEYPDTLLQIWHYHVRFLRADEAARAAMIKGLKGKRFHPLVATAMVLPGKGNNKTLFGLIRDLYKQESSSTQWQSEIMNSKWWLPLFKIMRYDPHNYDSFMESTNIPELLRLFPIHEE